MFTVHIDDSGTAPDQQVAIACALIIPASRIVGLDKEFGRLANKEGFKSFHMSECISRNKGSEFAGWDDAKQRRVISRVRQIGKKFGVQAVSIAITKDEYDTIVPPWLRELSGQFHYTWAMRNMLDVLDRWAAHHNVQHPFEYIYDWMDPKAQRVAKAEIETVMAQAEEQACSQGKPGRFTNYSFRRREDIPALQCTDALAWTCYQFALYAHRDIPLTDMAKESWEDYYYHLEDPYSERSQRDWVYAVGMKPEHLREWVEKESKELKTIARYEALKAKREESKLQKR